MSACQVTTNELDVTDETTGVAGVSINVVTSMASEIRVSFLPNTALTEYRIVVPGSNPIVV